MTLLLEGAKRLRLPVTRTRPLAMVGRFLESNGLGGRVGTGGWIPPS